jgi:hypothetical protein
VLHACPRTQIHGSWGNGRVEPQPRLTDVTSLAGLKQRHPFLGRRVVDDVAVSARSCRAAVEEEAVTAIQESDVCVAREEGQRGADQGHAPPRDVGDVAGLLGEALTAGDVVEADEGLGQLLALVGVGDEATPVFGHALEAADRLDGQS